MIDIDYYKFGLFRSKMVWFGNELPPHSGYHFVRGFNYFKDIDITFPFNKIQESTCIINLTKDADRLFGDIDRRRRQKIKRGYKEDIQIECQVASKEMLKEFCFLHNKYRVLRGNDPIILNNTILPLEKNIIIYKGLHDGQTLIMELLVHDGCIANRFHNVRNEDFISPASLYIGGVIIWEIIMDLKSRGYQILDLGGGGPFKLSFGGEKVPVYNYPGFGSGPRRGALAPGRCEVRRAAGRWVPV